MAVKFFILFFIFLLPQFTFAQNLTPVELVEILDGDTVKVKIKDNEFSVRLYGIDCFETGKINRAYKQAYIDNIKIEEVVKKGADSKNFLQSLYEKSNKKVYLEFLGLDIYKRALGVIYFDDLNVNYEMKNKGGCTNYTYKR